MFLFETHGDHVEKMPKGAQRIVYSDPTKYSGYYVPGNFWEYIS